MKIIFSKQFLSELQQVEQVIKLNKFSVLPISGSISKDNLLNTSFATSKDLYSIWDNEKKLLSLSISFEDPISHFPSTSKFIPNNFICFIFYSFPDETMTSEG